jgi:tungstate transport system permease protein
VRFFLDGFHQAWGLITSHDQYLWQLVTVTLKVAGVSTAIALVIGLPIALVLGLGRFRGRGVLIALANAGLGLPPVVVGLILALLMFPASPLGRFHLLFTLKGVYIAQTVLAFPVIVALCTSALSELRGGVVAQARAFHAPRWRIATLAVREARIGILSAIIAAVGSGLSEVGAVVLVGGNIEQLDQTLASAALEQVGAGHFSYAFAIGVLLLGLIVIVAALLTIVQHAGASRMVGRGG